MTVSVTIDKRRDRYILAAFLAAAFLLRIIYMSKVHGPIVYADEMGYWGHAANMTGNTWAGVMNGMPWYACGYSFLLMPIFLLQTDMLMMYRMAVVLNAVLGVLSFWLVYRIIQKTKSSAGSVLKAAILSFTATSYPAYIFHTYIAWSETLLAFLIWLVLYEIISLEDVPRCWKSVLLGSTVGYSYMVHNRMLAVVAAVLLTLVVLLLFKKIRMIDLGCFLVSLVVVVCIDAFLKGILRDLVENNAMLQEIGLNVRFSKANTLSDQIGKFLEIFSLTGLKNFLLNLAGQIWQLLSATYLLAGLGLIFCVKKLQAAFKQSGQIGLYLMPVLSVLFTIMMTSLFFIDQDYSALRSGSNVRIDTIFYGRYNDVFAGILMLIALECLVNRMEIKGFVKNIIGLGLVYLIVAIVVHCSLSGVEQAYLNIVSAVSIHTFHWMGGFAVWKCTLIAIVVCVVCVIIHSIKIRWQAGNYAICMFLVFLFLATALQCMRFSVNGENTNTQRYAEIFDFLNENTKAGEPVYAVASGKFAYDLQTRLVNKPVICITSDQLDLAADHRFIVLSEQEYTDLVDAEYDERLQKEGYRIIQKMEE